ncbi:MAG TPA: hypothetical protein VFR04_06805 [Solirubrobacterales bacterium]|nr:hypothetical protein [Solirubrobacterales bacterium]
MLATAAVIAAGLAAWTANRRIDKQLTHDRKMRDLDEMRGVIDEANGAVTESISAILHLRSRTPVIGYEQEKGETIEGFLADEEAVRIRREAAEDAHDKTFAVAPEHGRLRLRFGADHPVPQSYMANRDGLVTLIQAVDVLPENWTEETSQIVEGHLGRSGQLNAEFIERCRELVRVFDR